MSGHVLVPAKGRRTHSVHRTFDEAVSAARKFVWIMNGIPFGFHVGIIERFGAFAVASYPKVES